LAFWAHHNGTLQRNFAFHFVFEETFRSAPGFKGISLGMGATFGEVLAVGLISAIRELTMDEHFAT
jgi:hypothetical protein